MGEQPATGFQHIEYTQLNLHHGEADHSRWKQYIAGIAASTSIVASGAWFCWPAPLLPRLLDQDSPVPMTPEEASWMVSFIEVGTCISPFLGTLMADHLGRKNSMLLSTPLFVVSVALIIYIRTLWSLCLARFIQGLAMGIPYTVLPLYLGEIASSEARGIVSSFFMIAWSLGCLYPYCVGPYLSYNYLTYATFLLNIVFVVSFIWQPESPYYYALKNKPNKVTDMLVRLRDSTPEDLIKKEVEEIQLEVRKSSDEKASWKDVIATPTDRKALFLLLVVAVVSCLSGQNAMLTYSTDTFSKFSNNFIPPDFITIAIGIVTLIGGCISIPTSDTLGRRFLLLMSSVACAISLFIASGYFYLDSNTSVDVSSYSWVAPVAIMAFNFFLNAGMHPVCVVYTSELFPTKTRGIASCISSMSLTFSSLLVLKFYESISIAMGIYFTYLCYALVCFIGVFLFYFLMPETKGKTFLEIREALEKGQLK
ncbi:facilitated trehalose transporter Tret1-like [Homalodisca vitripennis]|uniref:facilitated trehalose transporter Tret1-like n=1 Tax=Homalodisca vitripennis TaxID=197043 RepID=UPI001EEBFA35|nr:facilitated trehalose transporter Tret1-like [Homalodisca vitripennis]